MRILKLMLVVFCLTGAFALQAQQDSVSVVTVADSTAVADTASAHAPFYKGLWSHDPHSVKRAALFSAVVPGLGQAYNGKYWKVPIVYAALGTSGYFIYYWYDFYDELRTAYIARTDTDPFTIDDTYAYIPSDEILLQYVTSSKRYLDVMVVVTFAVYALNIIDAVVDAHLYDFNISDDLTLQWQPSYFPAHTFAMQNTGTLGVNLKISLR